MVLSRAASAFQGIVPQEGRHGAGAGGQAKGSGRPPEPSWRERLARLIAWALAAVAMRLLVMAAMLARRGAISRRRWVRASRFCHRLQHRALDILRGAG